MHKRQLPLTVLLLATLLTGQDQSGVLPLLAEPLAGFPAVRDFSMAPGGDEAYFTVQSPLGELAVILVLRKGLFGWNTADIASFSGKYSDMEPFLTEDGLRLYFASNRPKSSESDAEQDYDIWYVERQSLKASWSEPIDPGPPVNSEHNEFYPSLARSGNLYFTTDRPGTLGKDDIMFSQYLDGNYAEPIPLDSAINSSGYEFNAFVAPDESYLIYTAYNRPDGLGSGDLYISYQDQAGSWSPAKNLGPDINSAQMDYCPFVRNAKLYFTSRRSQVHYPESGFSTRKQLEAELRQAANGQSHLYQVALPLRH